MPMGHLAIGLVTYTSCCLVKLFRNYHLAPISPPHTFWAQAPHLIRFFVAVVCLFVFAPTIQVPHPSSVSISCLLSDETHTVHGHLFHQ